MFKHFLFIIKIGNCLKLLLIMKIKKEQWLRKMIREAIEAAMPDSVEYLYRATFYQ